MLLINYRLLRLHEAVIELEAEASYSIIAEGFSARAAL